MCVLSKFIRSACFASVSPSSAIAQSAFLRRCGGTRDRRVASRTLDLYMASDETDALPLRAHFRVAPRDVVYFVPYRALRHASGGGRARRIGRWWRRTAGGAGGGGGVDGGE